MYSQRSVQGEYSNQACRGDRRKLEWVEAELPDPGPDEVLIQVHFAGVNRADLLQAKGALPPPPPGASEALGLECGIVLKAGKTLSMRSPLMRE